MATYHTIYIHILYNIARHIPVRTVGEILLKITASGNTAVVFSPLEI